MMRAVIRKIGLGITFAPPAAVAVASLLNLTVFERQLSILILLLWAGVFVLYRAFTGAERSADES